MTKNLQFLEAVLRGEKIEGLNIPLNFPPPVAQLIGFELVSVGPGTATMAMQTQERHQNPLGTTHGGILCDLADAAIGTAHATTLQEGETLTSIDLKINFFRPVWGARITATAAAVNPGKTLSYYECPVTNEEGKLVALVTSLVMTLRGDAAKGR